MKYFCLLIILFLLISCDYNSSEDYFKEAVKLEKSGNFKRAILFHNKALKINPKSIASLINRGSDKSELGDYHGAIIDLKSILEFDRDNTLAHYAIGDTYSELKEYTKAIKFYTKALQTKGIIKKPTIDTKKHSILFIIGNDQYSVQDYYIYFERGIAYLETNQYDKAIIDIKNSLLNENGISDCYFLLGKCYLGKKDSIKACNNFIESAKLGDKEAREMIKKHCLKNK